MSTVGMADGPARGPLPSTVVGVTHGRGGVDHGERILKQPHLARHRKIVHKPGSCPRAARTPGPPSEVISVLQWEDDVNFSSDVHPSEIWLL